MALDGRLLALAVVIASVAPACAASPGNPAPAAATDVLQEMALDGLARHGCASIVDRLLPLEEPLAKASSGRVWFRECTATRVRGGVRVRVALLGWQWVDARTGGFDVREYVYFRASVSGEISADVQTSGGDVVLALRLVGAPEVTVEDVGRVSARPANPAAALLGMAGGLFGYGANVLATSSMRSRVTDLVTARLHAGAALSLHEILAPAETKAEGWMNELQELHVGGALFAGPFAADLPSTLRFDVAGTDAVLVRPVCLAEAEATVDAIVAGGASPRATRPDDVRTLRGRGALRFARMPCPWVLVSGAAAKTSEAASTVVSLSLGPSQPLVEPHRQERIARVTLVDFAVNPTDPSGASWDPNGGAPDLLFVMSIGGQTLRFGPAMPDTLAATVWLESAFFVVRPDQVLAVRVTDLDPQRASLIDGITYVEQPVGTGVATAAQLVSPGIIRVPLKNGGSEVGWTRLLVESGDPE